MLAPTNQSIFIPMGARFSVKASAAADAFRGHMHTDAHAMERSSALQLLKGCVDLQRVREISGALSTHAAVAEAANETEDMC